MCRPEVVPAALTRCGVYREMDTDTALGSESSARLSPSLTHHPASLTHLTELKAAKLSPSQVPLELGLMRPTSIFSPAVKLLRFYRDS